MFAGMLLSMLGASMVWPFLMIYVSERLQLPLAQVGALMSLRSLAGLTAVVVAGPVVDVYGRRGAMVASLFGAGVAYFFMGWADAWWQFAVLMALSGLFTPLYRVGGDAMLADLVPPEGRAEAYAVLRMANNIGVSVGPAVGGFLAAVSYRLTFSLAAAGFGAYALLLAVAARETLPVGGRKTGAAVRQAMVEYGMVLRDGRLRRFIGAFAFPQMVAAVMWVFLGVYLKQHFGIPEGRYGLIAATNAVMVVVFQYAVTRRVKNYHPLRVMAAGALFYAFGVGSVALGSAFGSFWGSMVVMTVGEMLLVPTAATYVANLAPTDKRGRYMGLYGMLWNVSSGIVGPLGGWLNDEVSPRALWVGAALWGALGSLVFLRLAGLSSSAVSRKTNSARSG